MFTMIIVRAFSLTVSQPVDYIAPWVNPGEIVYKAREHRTVKGRMPWRTEALVSGLPRVMDKGDL